MNRLLPAIICSLFLLPSLCFAAGISVIETDRDFETRPDCDPAWKVAFDDTTLLVHNDHCSDSTLTALRSGIDRDRLYILVDKRASFEREGYEPIFSEGGFTLALVSDPARLKSNTAIGLRKISGDFTAVHPRIATRKQTDPMVSELLGYIDEQSYEGFMAALSQDLPTRFVCTSEVKQGRQAIMDHFESLGLEPSTPGFSRGWLPCDLLDVVAIKTGKVHPEQYYLVGAHHDSISTAPFSAAPGANDNASGAAGVMELAKAFSNFDTEYSVIFATFGAEEIGLVGSFWLTALYASTGMLDNVKGIVILDMISFKKFNHSVLVEGTDITAEQKQAVLDMTQTIYDYTDLVVQRTYLYAGSDHVPFLNAGIPGALLIESDWHLDPNYHTPLDTIDKQDIPFGTEIVRGAGAVLAEWAGLMEIVPDDDDDDSQQSDDDSAGDDSQHMDDDSTDGEDTFGVDNSVSSDDDDSNGACCG